MADVAKKVADVQASAKTKAATTMRAATSAAGQKVTAAKNAASGAKEKATAAADKAKAGATAKVDAAKSKVNDVTAKASAALKVGINMSAMTSMVTKALGPSIAKMSGALSTAAGIFAAVSAVYGKCKSVNKYPDSKTINDAENKKVADAKNNAKNGIKNKG